MRAPVLGCLLLAACGDGDAGAGALALTDTYDVIGVGRVLPDGLLPTHHRPFFWSLSNISATAGQVSLQVLQKGAAAAVGAAGSYDALSGRLSLDPFTASLTTTVTETATAMGADASEGTPSDGLAHELSGFIETRAGDSVLEGRFLAVSRTGRTPAAPDGQKVAAVSPMLGVVDVDGAAGSVIAHAAVEIFVYTLGLLDPAFFLTKADGDGAFHATVDGLVDDVVVIRARSGGTAGDGRWVVVSRKN